MPVVLVSLVFERKRLIFYISYFSCVPKLRPPLWFSSWVGIEVWIDELGGDVFCCFCTPLARILLEDKIRKEFVEFSFT